MKQFPGTATITSFDSLAATALLYCLTHPLNQNTTPQINKNFGLKSPIFCVAAEFNNNNGFTCEVSCNSYPSHT